MSDFSDSSSSDSTQPTPDDDNYKGGFGFCSVKNNRDQSEESDGASCRSSSSDSDDDFNSTSGSYTGLRLLSDSVSGKSDEAAAISTGASGSIDMRLPSLAPEDGSSFIPHRGSLRRILNPSSFHAQNSASPTYSSASTPKQSQSTSTPWPMYAVNVAAETSPVEHRHNNMNPPNECNSDQLQQCYQIIFDRQQYEFCTRLFALLDTESQSCVGPDCIREFVCLHCPVVRRRDDAIYALIRGGEIMEDTHGAEIRGGVSSSPTFDEIWERTVNSDPRYMSADITPDPGTQQIGIEGWMVFCRLLALAHHQESQRRFASRHLQQMMRHKHGAGSSSGRVNPNEVVVVVDNPPPGPPLVVSIRSLVNVEKERALTNSEVCIDGWPFCPLPPIELDFDHCLVSSFNTTMKSPRMHICQRGAVSVEPFSSSREGDFILRFQSNTGATMVVRRSYSDFDWLHHVLMLHKRPGQGHLCGRILPPFPSSRGIYHHKHIVGPRSSGAITRHSKDLSGRAIEAAKSGMGMISSMAKSVWSEYVTGSPSSSPKSTSSKAKSGATIPSARRSCLANESDVPTILAHRIERYLNYLVENDALSYSFTLKAILQASQSGLESAKQTLEDHARNKRRQRSNLASAPSSVNDPHSAASIFTTLISKTPSSLLRFSDNSDQPWLRSAARVAMALQFHGILETTGYESTSAKIQHASLPKFRSRPGGSWDEEDANHSKRTESSESDSPKSETNFEAGVINVESELAAEEDLGGYDMLPSPGPSDEHRVLNAGRTVKNEEGSSSSEPNKSRYVYDMTSEQGAASKKKDSVLGPIRVENDVDKLRGIIRSINHTLGKLHRSSAVIRSAQKERNFILLDLLRDVDTWGEGGGEIISQRALVNGVASLETCATAIEKSNTALTDGKLEFSLFLFFI